MNFEHLFNQIVKQLKYNKDLSFKGLFGSRETWREYSGSRTVVETYSRGKSVLVDKIMDKIAYDFKLNHNVNLKCEVFQVQINYYKTNNEFLHEHSHNGHSTLLLSLGESRILTIEDESILLNNGDIAIFHSQKHGVPALAGNSKTFIQNINKKNQFKGRISIVFFYRYH